jgi:hypothetical protein
MLRAAHPPMPCDLLHFAGYDVPANIRCAGFLLTDRPTGHLRFLAAASDGQPQGPEASRTSDSDAIFVTSFTC